MATAYEKRFSTHVKVDVAHAFRRYAELLDDGKLGLFGLFNGAELVGGLAGLLADDLHYPQTLAIELFWFVLEGYRGKGLLLLNEFERWAEENNARPAAIALSDSFASELDSLYTRRGYQLAERHYLKGVTT